MRKYSGYEFDPDLNRLLMDLSFVDGKSDIIQKAVSPEDPYAAPHPGYHTRDVEVSGRKMEYTMYIPKYFKPFGEAILLFVPGGYTAKEYMERNGYAGIAEQENTVYIGLQCPHDNWLKWELNEALEYVKKVYDGQNIRDLCAINEGGYGAMGFDDAAYTAAVFSMLYSSVLAASVLVNVPDIDETLIYEIGELPADGNPLKKKTEVPLSVWLVGNNNKLLDYFQKINNTGCRLLAEGYSVYYQKVSPSDNTLNVQSIGEVRHSSSFEQLAPDYASAVMRLTEFANGFKRQPGIGEKFYRATQKEEDLNVEFHEEVINGLKRRWYVFTPSEYGKIPGKKYPVVMGLHGVCSTGLDFQRISEWNRIAESKQIIMIYPFGYMRQFSPVMAPTVAWTYEDDDVAYLRYLTEFVKGNYEVDVERMYLTGHSNGSGMTQTVLRKAPELFAAYAPIGLAEGELTDNEMAPPILHRTKCPVWLLKGEFDIGCAASLAEGTPNTNMLKHWCALNNCSYEDGRRYTNGAYETTTFYDSDHVPYVRFTNVIGMYHAFNPEMSHLIWDYFCHFKRRTDGTVEYLG